MKKIDRFKIIERISEGGAAVVYKAEEQLPGGLTRPVALKVFPALAANDKVGEARFTREIQPMLVFSGHPHIVCFYGAAVTDGTPWIAMEYAEKTLAETLAELPATPEEVQRLLEHVGFALATMHAQQPPILHNDLKPANVMICAGPSYKLADFGVAGKEGEERTRVVTTVRYAAPELLSREFGAVSAATDLYALGHIAYEMSLGAKQHRQQFTGVFDERTGGKDTHAGKWMAWHCSIGMAAPALHEVQKGFPVALSQVIAKLMAKPLANRYISAKEMLADLRQSAPPAVVAAPAQVLPSGPGRGAAQLLRRPQSGAAAITAQRPATAPTPAAATPVAPARAPAVASGGAVSYYVRLRDRKSGPFDWKTLQQQAKQGLVSRLHQISTDETTWRPAGSIEGLF